MSPEQSQPPMPQLPPGGTPFPPMFGQQQRPKKNPYQQQSYMPSFIGGAQSGQLGSSTLLGAAA